MRKGTIWVLLLVVLLVTACGRKQDTDEGKKLSVTEQGKEEAEMQEEASGTEEEAPVQAQEAEPEAEYQKGTISDIGWESEYLGLGYTAPEGMHMSTQEELDAMMGLGKELLSDDFDALQLNDAEMTSAYEMMSSDDTGAVNVIVAAEKGEDGEGDAEAYADAIRQRLASLSSVLYTIDSENKTALIGGEDFITFTCIADYGNVSMCQDYYIRVYGDRVVSITVTYMEQMAELAGQAVAGFKSL